MISTQGHGWSKQTLTSATICHHNGNDYDDNSDNSDNNDDDSDNNDDDSDNNDDNDNNDNDDNSDNNDISNDNNDNNSNSKGNNTQKTKLVTLAFFTSLIFFAKSLNLLLFSSSSSKSDIPLNLGNERLTNNRFDSSMGPPLLDRFFAAPNKSEEKISAWWSSGLHGPRFKSCFLKTFSGESKQIVIKH